MIFEITECDAGKTVLCFLKRKISVSHKSLSFLKQQDNGISVNDLHVTVRYVLKSGDILRISDADISERISENIAPGGTLPCVLYEDEYVIALDKPGNMPTHPSHDHTDDTLANCLAKLYLDRGQPFVFRPAGRLDRNTSGVVICAKTQAASAYLTRAVVERRVQKRYIALLDGVFPDGQRFGRITAGIRRTDNSIIMRTVCDAEPGSPEWAATNYRVLAEDAARRITLVEALPETGRTHQLRVHFASVGLPLLGDEIYGRHSDLIPRHALHAESAEFPLPFDGKTITVHSPIPADMAEIINSFPIRSNPLCKK